MILTDTSVWVAFFRDIETRQTELLAQALLRGDVVLGDLVLVEILQGLKHPKDIRLIMARLEPLDVKTLCGPTIAPIAAANYRLLRRSGVTIRGTIDVIIATWCMESGVALLHDDRDFDAMVPTLGLVVHA